MKYFLKSMRPEQWTKNLAVFAGLIFSDNLIHTKVIIESIFAFLLFSFIAGANYIINDISDLEADRAHKTKSKRPLAAGKLKVRPAIVFALLLAVATIVVAFLQNLWFGVIIAIYFVLNTLYSLWLKNLVIIDVLVVSADFVLRVLGGVVILSVVPTPWIIICTIFLAFFLSLCKRRQEIVLLKEEAAKHRKILASYTVTFLDQLIIFSSVSVVFSYILFTGISGKNINLMYTIPFVLYGIVRYLYLIHIERMTYLPTEALLKDKPLLLCVLLWTISVIVILYSNV